MEARTQQSHQYFADQTTGFILDISKIKKEVEEEEQETKNTVCTLSKTGKRKMGRSNCCDKQAVRKGAWSPEEDKILVNYITENGLGVWSSLPKLAGLPRGGKSCRLRWVNYLCPDIKRGPFSHEEKRSILELQSLYGNKWAEIASYLPGRTDNDIKNLWNTNLKKRVKPSHYLQHQPSLFLGSTEVKKEFSFDHPMVPWIKARLEAEFCLPLDPALLCSSSKIKTEYDDPFLRLWNSEVGERFREGVDCPSHLSQASSSTKYESTSGVNMHINSGLVLSSADSTGKQKQIEYLLCKDSELGSSFISKSPELDASTYTTTKLHLEFPNGSEIDVLKGCTDDDFSMYLQEPI